MGKDIHQSFSSGIAFSEVISPDVWRSYSFAPEWFADALNEARFGKDHHARRREIIFAACCAESYIVEWIRDEVLKRKFGKLDDYFPPTPGKEAVRDKWKKLFDRLVDTDQLVQAKLDFGKPFWKNFLKLMDMRNGLVHGRSSRPEAITKKVRKQPHPSKAVLDDPQLSGWPTQVVVILIREIHAKAGTQPPVWLVDTAAPAAQ